MHSASNRMDRPSIYLEGLSFCCAQTSQGYAYCFGKKPPFNAAFLGYDLLLDTTREKFGFATIGPGQSPKTSPMVFVDARGRMELGIEEHADGVNHFRRLMGRCTDPHATWPECYRQSTCGMSRRRRRCFLQCWARQRPRPPSSPGRSSASCRGSRWPAGIAAQTAKCRLLLRCRARLVHREHARQRHLVLLRGLRGTVSVIRGALFHLSRYSAAHDWPIGQRKGS